jgi:hypothetical protein
MELSQESLAEMRDLPELTGANLFFFQNTASFVSILDTRMQEKISHTRMPTYMPL